MKHFIVFFYIFSYTSGLIAMSLSFISYIRYKSIQSKYYLYFIVSLTAILLQQTVTSYSLANQVSNTYMDVIMNFVQIGGCGLMIYALPMLTFSLFNIKYSERMKNTLMILGLLPAASLVLYYTTPFKFFIMNIVSSFFFLVIFYCIYLIAKNAKSIKEEQPRKILRVFFYISIVFVPLMFLDTKIERIPGIGEYFQYGLLTVPAFYLVCNIMTVYYGLKYFLHQGAVSDKDTQSTQSNAVSIEESFFERYGITSREKEVILLLLKGISYNKIAEDLTISLTTVKTHIHNIYQKTGVNNKVELINLIMGQKTEV